MSEDSREKKPFLQQRTARIAAEVEVTIAGPNNFFSGFTQDISRGGVFVATPQVYPIGTEFDVVVIIDGRELNVHAKVLWVRELTAYLPEGIEPGMGLAFIDLRDEDQKIIEQFIHKREPIFYE